MTFPNILDYFSFESAIVAELFWIVLIVSIVIMGIVWIAILVSSIKFHHSKQDDSEPKQIFGNHKLELAWTIIPALILVWFFYLTVTSMMKIDKPISPDQKADVIITGKQWWWEATYPESGVVTANEIHIPTKKNLLFKIESADVIHSFWVAALSPKKDAIPGQTNHLWIQADEPGTYLGNCAEFCGPQHAWMRIMVVAESQEDFDAWEKQQLEPVSTPTTESAKRGEDIFMNMICFNCHAIDGTPAEADIAPNLTNLATRKWIGSGTIPNTPENLRLWLKDPQAIKPGAHMPNFKLSDAQVNDVANYLETLK